MTTYSVKQIADMLNTQPETVRRWIRNGKLYAEKTSRKDGHIVTEGDLNKFLKNSPKYAGIAVGAVLGASLPSVATLPVVGSIFATYLATAKIVKDTNENSISKEDMKIYLREEIERRTKSINQKKKTIEQIQQEIENDQQQIIECNFMLKQLDIEEK